MEKIYNSCSVDTWDGKIYWHKGFETLDQVYAHLKRYVHKRCDILIYDISGSRPIKFVGIIRGYDSEKENNPLLKVGGE